MIKTFKLFALFIIILGSSSIFVFGQKKIVHPIKPKDFDSLGLTNDFKILGEGVQSKVDKPFVFVARDEKAYAELKILVDELPAVSNIDFTKNAVVAGFAGERSTGGWSVEIRKVGKKILIDIHSPRKDMMVTQMITTSFKVSLIPLEENDSLSLDFSSSFAKSLKTFQVIKGQFEFTGGFAGIHKSFIASGTVKMMSFGNYATTIFSLKGKGIEQKRHLSDISLGTLNLGKLELSRLSPGSFVESPHPQFFVNGITKGKRLSLHFESLQTTVADGFSGRGTLEAIQIK